MPPKVHTEIDRNVHAQLKHLREKLGPNATLSDALALAITSSKNSVALQIDPSAPARAFFREKDSKALPQEIKASTLNLAGLLDLATTLTDKPAPTLLEEGLVASCTQAIIDHFRVRAGDANARGASDHKIAQAYADLVKTGTPPTPSKIRAICGSNLNAIKRWLKDSAPQPVSKPKP